MLRVNAAPVGTAEQAAMDLAVSCSRPSRSGAAFGQTSRNPYVPLGARPKPDVRNPLKQRAHAPLPANRLDIRACHPASNEVTELLQERFRSPTFRLSRKAWEFWRDLRAIAIAAKGHFVPVLFCPYKMAKIACAWGGPSKHGLDLSGWGRKFARIFPPYTHDAYLHARTTTL
jgi:hypothetical protein